MSAPADPPADPRAASASGPAPARRWIPLLPPVLTVVLALLALGDGSEWFTAGGGFDGFELGLLAWSWSPAVALLLLLTVRVGSRTRRTVVGVGGLLLLALTATAYGVIRTSDSSTAALGYLFVPAWGWLVVVLTVVALGVVAVVRRRTSR